MTTTKTIFEEQTQKSLASLAAGLVKMERRLETRLDKIEEDVHQLKVDVHSLRGGMLGLEAKMTQIERILLERLPEPGPVEVTLDLD